MSTSFEEKSVWIQLGSLMLAFGGYFVVSGKMMAEGVWHLAPYVPVFAVATALLVVIMVVAYAAAAVVRKPEERDERDRLIGWRAEAGTSWILAAGVFGAITALLFAVSNVWVAHLLLFSLFASEVIKCAVQLRLYRRGV